MLPDRVSNPGPLTYESGDLPIALRGLSKIGFDLCIRLFNLRIEGNFGFIRPKYLTLPIFVTKLFEA